jgi:hypothetical protein
MFRIVNMYTSFNMFKKHPDDDPTESKQVAVWMFYAGVFDVYCLFFMSALLDFLKM